MYEVVNPAGKPVTEEILSTRSVELDLTGKRVGLVRIPFPNSDILLEALAGLLEERFEGLECVKLSPGKGLVWGDRPDSSLADIVKEAGIDAAMVAIGC